MRLAFIPEPTVARQILQRRWCLLDSSSLSPPATGKISTAQRSVCRKAEHADSCRDIHESLRLQFSPNVSPQSHSERSNLPMSTYVCSAAPISFSASRHLSLKNDLSLAMNYQILLVLSTGSRTRPRQPCHHGDCLVILFVLVLSKLAIDIRKQG